MGRAYAKGWTRAANYMKALPYYRKGAEWDHRVAMMDYGKMLIHGAGTQADPVLGRQWIEKAARAGLSHAQYALGDLAHKGIGGPKNLNEFLKWTQAAADQEFRKPTATLECFS